MHVLVNELLDLGREVAILRKLGRKSAGLCLGGDLASEEEPEHTLGDDLLASLCGREELLALGDGEPVEADAL